jgi:hypothetical protein
VNATTYLPMRVYQRMSNGQQSVADYVFLQPTPENLAKLRPVIPAGYTRSSAPGPKPHICRPRPETRRRRRTSQFRDKVKDLWPDRSGSPATRARNDRPAQPCGRTVPRGSYAPRWGEDAAPHHHQQCSHQKPPQHSMAPKKISQILAATRTPAPARGGDTPKTSPESS